MTPRRTALVAAALATPALIAAMLVAPATAAAVNDVAMEAVGRYVAPRTPAKPANEPDDVRAESHAVSGDRLYATNHTSLDIVDISDPSNPVLVTQVDLSLYGGTITSVAADNGRVAVAIPATDKTQPGSVVLLNPAGKVLRTVTVGALPDMLVFDEKGKRLIVANEGEPSQYPSTPASDPVGSISIIDVAKLLGGKADAVTTVGFDSVSSGSLNEYVRIFGPGASIAQDLEPEYVTIEGDRAFVSLQENNAIAEINLSSATLVGVRGLEFKDHNVAGNGLDASDREVSTSQGAITIANWPVTGIPLPDGIASFTVAGQAYIISANEGDARADWPGFNEEARIGDVKSGSATVGGRTVTLDPALTTLLETVGTNGKKLSDNTNLGRLRFTAAPGRAGGDLDNDQDIDQIQTYGTRSVSIWTPDGTRVWDSGDMLERETALQLPSNFNANNSGTSNQDKFDGRSDDKGPEPEGVAVGEINGRTYAFIGLERVGGMAVFDVTNPTNPAFVEHVTTRDFSKSPVDGTTDSGPEVMSFVPAEDSPNGKPLVVASNEWSGSIVIWAPKP